MAAKPKTPAQPGTPKEPGGEMSVREAGKKGGDTVRDRRPGDGVKDERDERQTQAD